MINVISGLVSFTLVLATPSVILAQYADILPTQTGTVNPNSDDPNQAYEVNRYQRRPRVGPVERRLESDAQPEASKKKPIPATKKKVIKIVSDPQAPEPVSVIEEPSINVSPGVLENFRDVLIGGSGKDLKAFTRRLEKNDIRRNYIEMSISSLFLHNTSNSRYWYRSYVTNTPAIKFANTIWFGPFLGFHFDYTSTLGGSMSNDPFGPSKTKFTDQELNVGFKSRSFYQGMGDDSNLSFFLGYFEYQKHVPTDDDQRTRLATRGLDLTLEARIKEDEMVYDSVGFTLRPFSWHEETSTGQSAKTGNSNETFGAKIFVGREYKFSRRNRFFWKGTWAYEKNQFNGRTTAADPKTGERPQSTAVENTKVMIELGYLWGD